MASTPVYLTKAGYDLTVFEVYKDFDNGVKLYRIGLSLEIINSMM